MRGFRQFAKIIYRYENCNIRYKPTEMNQPLPQSFKEFLEPVKQFIDHDPTPKKVLIDRAAGKVDYHVLNFLKMFSFIEIRKLDNDELIVV